MLGSANLSHNGLGSGLREAAMLVSDSTALEEMHHHLDALRDQAVSDPGTQQKMLAALKTRWDRAHVEDTLPNEVGQGESPATLADWEPHQERIHVAWYRTGDWAYDEAVMHEAVPDPERNALDDTDAMTFLEGDDIQVGDWKGRAVSWMQVHRLVPGGATHETQGKYTQVALACPDHATPPPEPFELTPEVQMLVRDLLVDEKYRDLWGESDVDDWSANAARPIAQRFLVDLKAAYMASRDTAESAE